MPEVILNELRIRGLVAVFADRKPGGAPVQGLALLADKNRPAGRFHFRAIKILPLLTSKMNAYAPLCEPSLYR